MIHNQLARRNLNDSEMAYLWGRRYLGEVKPPHRPKGNQSDDLKGKTSERIAAELGVGVATVQRAGDFAKAVDAIAESCGPEIKDLILALLVATLPFMSPVRQGHLSR